MSKLDYIALGIVIGFILGTLYANFIADQMGKIMKDLRKMNKP